MTTQAQLLAAAGDLAGAHRMLNTLLATADPDPARASESLADAAGLQARVLIALGEPQGARTWAAFAYTAHRRLYGPSDERTVVATATLAAALHRLGNDARATALYHDVVAQLTALDGADSARVLAAQADLATVEHARGDCAAARARLAEACRRHQATYGTGDLAGIKMLARLGAMERDCGNYPEAHRQFERARQLCTEEFGPTHPMVAQIAALARAPADPVHICRHTATAPGTDRAGTHDRTGAPERTGTGPVGTQPSAPFGEQPPRQRPNGPDPSAGHPQPVTGGPAATPAWPQSDDDDLAAYGWQAEPAPAPDPARLTGAHQGTGGAGRRDDELDPWWPPEPPPAQPGPAAAGQPARVPMARDGEPAGAVAIRSTGGRLPVPLDRPDDRSRHPGLFVAAGAAVVALGTAAVALGMATWGADDPGRRADPPPQLSAPAAGPAPSSGTRATPTRPAGGTPSAPAPTGVTLKDQRDSVTLAWTYPAGSEGPVLIAGARSGQRLQAFQELPAGSDTYIVYGLNERTDYCFRISVVYAANTVASARPVCTSRRPR